MTLLRHVISESASLVSDALYNKAGRYLGFPTQPVRHKRVRQKRFIEYVLCDRFNCYNTCLIRYTSMLLASTRIRPTNLRFPCFGRPRLRRGRREWAQKEIEREGRRKGEAGRLERCVWASMREKLCYDSGQQSTRRRWWVRESKAAERKKIKKKKTASCLFFFIAGERSSVRQIRRLDENRVYYTFFESLHLLLDRISSCDGNSKILL